jgi:hypothetical protein
MGCWWPGSVCSPHLSRMYNLENNFGPRVCNYVIMLLDTIYYHCDRQCISQWPPGLRRGSAAVRLLGLWVRIPPGARMSVCCECCVLSDRDLCVGLITRPEESYWVWFVWVWSWSLDNEKALAHYGLPRHEKKNDRQYSLKGCWHVEACIVQMGFVGDKMGQDFLLVLRNCLPIFNPQMPIHIYQEGQNIRSIRGCSIKELGVTRFLKIKKTFLCK